MITTCVYIHCSNIWISDDVWKIVCDLELQFYLQKSLKIGCTKFLLLQNDWLVNYGIIAGCPEVFYFILFLMDILAEFCCFLLSEWLLDCVKCSSPGVIRPCHLSDLDWGEIGINSCSYLLSHLKNNFWVVELLS